MNISKMVIPAAGRGVRLYPITKSLPKEMLPLGRKPAIQLVAEEVFSSGFSVAIIVTAMEKRAIEDHLDAFCGSEKARPENGHLFPDLLEGDGKFFYVRQSQPLGLGHAVLVAQELIKDEPFGVALGDAVIWSNGGQTPLLKRMIDTLETRAPAGVIAVRKVEDEALSRYGIIAPLYMTDDCIRVQDIVEKPDVKDAPSDLAVSGRYVFAPTLLTYLRSTLPDHNNEIQLTDAIRAMIHDGHEVLAVPLDATERRYDVGSFEEYVKAFVEIALQDEDVGQALRAHLSSLLAGAYVDHVE